MEEGRQQLLISWGAGGKNKKTIPLSNKRSKLFPECGWEGPKGQGAGDEGRGWSGATRPRRQLWRHRKGFKELGVGRS